METINLEEEDEQKQRKQCCLYKESEVSIGSDWVKQFLDMSDEELYEVVSSGEVKKPNADDEDDDDCVILDGDPEKEYTHVNDSSNGSDELLVVGEKGQIACRDYPHPRHLCATFSYDSTPHERYCAQCHCYVCDSPAPCLKWGNGLLITDHCHATDKSVTWKTLRKDSKLVKTVPLPASTNNGTLGNVVSSQYNPILPYDIERLSSNSMLVNLKSRSMALPTHPVNLITQNQATYQHPVNLTPQNQASRPHPGYLTPQNQASHPHPLYLTPQNQASRPHPLYLTPQNQASRPHPLYLTPQNQASRPRPVFLTPQNQASHQITMNACSSQRSRLQNQALRSTEMHPLSENHSTQNPASRPITMNANNALSSISSRLQNQGSRSNETHPLSENLVPSRLQNQISRPNNVLGRFPGSSFTIPNGANNGSYQEPGSTLVTNKYPSHAPSRMSLGVRSHSIQKNSGHRIGIGNTAATDRVTPLGASGFINRVNPQDGHTNHAAVTGFSNSGNCYAENSDVLIAQAINSLPTQPNHSPAYETQTCNQSDDSQSADRYVDIWVSYLAQLDKNKHLNEHEIGSENENINNSGGAVENVIQQKPDCGGIENKGFLAKDSNTNKNISYVENLVSNAKESNTPSSGNTHPSLDEIKHWLLDSN